MTNIPGSIRTPRSRLAAPGRPVGHEEAFHLAKVSATNRTWQPSSVSADSAVRESIDLGLPRSREQYYNNPQWKNAAGKLTDLIVGPGVQAYSEPFSPLVDISDEQLDFDLGYAFESDSWFERWADDRKQCDAEGKLSFWDMQRLAFQDLVLAGDVLILRVNKRGPGRIIPLCYQILEREQLDRTKDRPAEPGFNKIVNGIELDEFDAPVAYHIYDAHPDDSFYANGNGSSRQVPAERVIHAYIPFRPSSNCGYPWFHALAQTGRDRHWLVGSALTKEAIGALLTLVQKGKNGRGRISLEDGEDGTDQFGNELVKLSAGGNSVRIGEGEELEMFQPNTQAHELASFVDIIDHDAAGGTGLSYLRYSGRWEDHTYTAGRGAQNDDDQHCKPLKNWWGRSTVLPIRQAVNSQMVAASNIKTISEREFLADQLRFQSFFMIGAGREYLDPEGETDSAKAKLASGLSTLRDECGKQGLHWVKVLRQIRLENRILKRFEIQLDFSKGGGQQAGSRIAGESTSETKARQKAGGKNAAA